MTMREVYIKTILILAAVMLPALSASACSDSITIDSVRYAVPSQWQGLCVDSGHVADPSQLVRIPSELCYQDYRIFVTADTREALVAMAEAARKDSITFVARSGYRSSGYQKGLLRRRMDKGMSFIEATKYVAPPGFSEHVTGTALDLATKEGPFAASRAYRWLRENGHRYGFVETYPDDSLSTLPWEPWHWCYSPQRAAAMAPDSTASAADPD